MAYYKPVTLLDPSVCLPVSLRFDFARAKPLEFSAPLRVIRAHTLAEVLPALEAVQEACKAGFYAAGYVTYEAAPAFDKALVTHPPGAGPLVWFGIFSGAKAVPAISASVHNLGSWAFDTSEATYQRTLATIRERIAEGVTYQSNYTVRLQSPDTPDDPYALYQTLRAQHNPPYAAFLETGEQTILSLSPELFFQTVGDRVTTRPMKGTAARGRFSEEDEASKSALLENPKERAENVMIVDLLRNDLGKLALPGSVEVPELLTLETYPTFHTLTSTICATLPQHTGLQDIFRALFPCGSVTGAPKVSTMKLISDLETSPRGVYCGAIGYVEPGGAATFSVPIRTIVLSQGRAEYGVGSGVTWDSRAEDEYHELAVKAALVTEQEPDFCLLETLLWNGHTFVRLKRHLARVAESAVFFGFSLDKPALRQKLREHSRIYSAESRRVRMLVARDGTMTIKSSPFAPTKETLKIALAKEPVHSRDTFLFHKTTRRSVYDTRRQDVPDADDALLWNERGELTEFTIGNLVLELGGKLLTPPREAGLLNGVMRQEGLEVGRITEETLRLGDLQHATRIWRINSLRGWQKVKKAVLEST